MFKKFIVSLKILPNFPEVNIPFHGPPHLKSSSVFIDFTEVELTKTNFTPNSAQHFPWEDNGEKECQDFNNTIKF